MNRVKCSFAGVSAKALLMTAAASLSIGCSSAQLKRFAPPGLVKYEELAGDQPPNPVIQERIEDLYDADDRPFPRIVDTPSVKPVKMPAQEQAALTDALESARDDLETDIDTERAAAEADRTEADLLPEARDALKEQLERENAIAARERRTPIDRDRAQQQDEQD